METSLLDSGPFLRASTEKSYQIHYKSRLTRLNLLPIAMILEINDLLFFITSWKSPSPAFDIHEFVSFASSTSRSSSANKMVHILSRKAHNTYFRRLPRLWNSLPYIDLFLPTSTLTNKIKGIFWSKFKSTFNANDHCSYHYLCPCCKCSATPLPPKSY